MVLIVGQNSVWQNTYNLSSLLPGTVNRMTAVFASAAGKGSNVARALGTLGRKSLLLAYVGGPNGVKFAGACEEDGIRSDFTHIQGETRICTTLIEETGRITEIVEPSPPITEQEREAYHESFRRHLGDATFLAVSGTAMIGENEDCYLEFVRLAHEHDVPVLLDSYRNHGRLALEASPEILKINAEELAELSGKDCSRVEGRKEAARSIMERHGVRWIIITRGKDGAEAYDSRRSIRASAPRIELKNAIGSGDSFTAGIIGAVLDHLPPRSELSRRRPLRSDFPWRADLSEVLRLGTAMGTANCMNIKPGLILSEDLEKVLASTETRELHP